MNFFILDGANMVLKHTIIYGCSGFAKLHQSLEDVWMPDIKNNQLPSVLSGLNGVRTLVNVGTGLRDLVVIPVREYQKDGRIVRSISKGAFAFARTTGGELTRFGTKLAIGAQTALQGAEDYLSGTGGGSDARPRSRHGRPLNDAVEASSSDDEEERHRTISRYADQPTGILQGLKGAARSLERDLLTTRDVIVAISGEVREGAGAGEAARAVARHAPTLVLRPMIGVSRAVAQTLMGATNSVDPGNRRRVEDVSIFSFLQVWRACVLTELVRNISAIEVKLSTDEALPCKVYTRSLHRVSAFKEVKIVLRDERNTLVVVPIGIFAHCTPNPPFYVAVVLAGVKYAAWSVTSSPATLALVSVEMAPLISALSATRDTSPLRPGDICDSTPICVPREPMLAKPHSAYVAMRRERGDRAAYIGSFCRA